MKKNIPSFLAGIVAMLAVMSLSVGVYAITNAKTITETFMVNAVNISADGRQVVVAGENYKLSDGTEMPTSIAAYGTTYVPLRKLGEIANKAITWDSKTNTAGFNDKNWRDPMIGAIPYEEFRAMWKIDDEPQPKIDDNPKMPMVYNVHYVGASTDVKEVVDLLDSAHGIGHRKAMFSEFKKDHIGELAELCFYFGDKKVSAMW